MANDVSQEKFDNFVGITILLRLMIGIIQIEIKLKA
jgi:hypothetical protein